MRFAKSPNKKSLKRSSHGKKAKLFKFEGRLQKSGPLSFVPVHVEGREERKTLLDACIVTVPKSCGTAVKRNKFRRLVKEYLRTEHAELLGKKTIWIRVSRDFKLSNKIILPEWKPLLDKLLLSGK